MTTQTPIIFETDPKDEATIYETVFLRTIAAPATTVAEDGSPWEPIDHEMGAAGHDITWSTGHTSSSATVCDLYLDDASVLLAVITPAHQQALNMVQVGTASYTVPGAP